MKQLVKSAIKSFAAHAPPVVVENMFDACSNRIGHFRASARISPKLRVVELGILGDLGLIRGPASDEVIMAMYACSGKSESSIGKEIQQFFANKSGTYIDVGANIGLTTIPIALNPSIRCLAFEPEPSNFEYLKLNVGRNAPSGNVEYYQMALFDKSTTLSLALSNGNIGDHRIIQKQAVGRRVVEVRAVPLDDFYDRIDGPLAVKIDTQGAEPWVLAGGRRVLRRAGLVAMEFCPYLMRQLGGDPNVIVDLVSQFDQVALLEPASEKPPEFTSSARARQALLQKLSAAMDTDADYLDVILRRDG